MREILFKAKSARCERWHEGLYVKRGNLYFIQSNDDSDTVKKWWVIPETISQYTGLKDRNGVKIFENDILKDEMEIDGVPEDIYLSVAYMTDDFFGGAFVVMQGEEFDLIEKSICREFAVVGNIFDNPELLEENNEQNRN